MDAHEFDHMTRAVSPQIPRRTLVGLLGLSSLSVIGPAEAKKKKVKRNDFGCVDVGKFCKNAGQCCSGICDGKKGKKTCKAHDQSTCQPGQDICLGAEANCTTTTGLEGQCGITTGKASYCFSQSDCFPCSKDTDCEPAFGAGAACIVCAECAATTPRGTVCVSTAQPI